MSGTTLSGTYFAGVTLTQAAYNPVLVTGTVTVGSGIALYGGGSTTIGDTIVPISWTVTNEGLLRSEGAGPGGGYGVSLAGGGSVTNTSSATIYGYQGGVRVSGGAGTIINAGTIIGLGAGADAIGLASGYANAVIVDPGASFVGTVDGGNAPGGGAVSTLELASAAAAGTLAALGTQFIDFGQVSVDAGATWTLTSDALGGGYVVVDDGTLTNTGSIGSEISLGAGAVLSNTTGAAISGIFAVYGIGAGATVTNAGSLGGTVFGVRMPDGGTVINQDGGTITANVFDGVDLATTVDNNGLISGPTDGIYGASWAYNRGDGVITGSEAGVNLVSGILINAGQIDATGGYGKGVLLASDGVVTNQSGGNIAASGLGVDLSANAGTVINYGTISGTYYGVTRATSVSNDGTISGGKGGLNLWGGSVSNLGTVLGTGPDSTGILLQHGGSVSNASSGVISGTGLGVNLSGGVGTLINAGYIGGSLYAVSFGAELANRLIIDPGATFSGKVDGYLGSSSTMELASGGQGVFGGLGSQYINFTQVVVDPGASWSLTGDNTLAIGVTLLAGATLDVTGTVASGESIVFAGNGTELIIDGTASMQGAVTQFGPHETIDLRNVAYTSVSYSHGHLDYTPEGGGSASFPLSVALGATIFPASDGAGGTEITTLCFCAGTLLATPDGEVPVERLEVGDTVLTASGAARPIVWIGVGRVLAARGQRGPQTPVIVRKGALADNVPYRDLHVTKGHAFWFDDALIPVEFLVNHRSILWDDRAQEVALYHVELDRHDVLLANGAPAESYRDDGNRWLFSNANSGWGMPGLPPCAPVLTGGPMVDAVWRRLLARSGPRPGVPLTDHPDLHLSVDGMRVDGMRLRADAWLFRLTAPRGCVRVMSRMGVPQEFGRARDPRPLGVALRRVMLRRAARLVVIEADDPRLAQGFHAFEQDLGLRWTDGEGLLPAHLFEGFDGPIELELQLGGITQYPADAMVIAA